jgi:hypothetical protein
MRFATKARRTIAAVTGLNHDLRPIKKFTSHTYIFQDLPNTKYEDSQRYAIFL